MSVTGWVSRLRNCQTVGTWPELWQFWELRCDRQSCAPHRRKTQTFDCDLCVRLDAFSS